MIITLTGENNFERTRELNRLVDEFISEYGDLGLERIDGETDDLARIREVLTSLPFLASKKLVVFKNPSGSKEFIEQFEPQLKDLPETTDLVIYEPKLDKRTGFYKYLVRSTSFKEFKPLDAGSLAGWLVKEAGERGGQLAAADARFIVERAGLDQQKLSGELDKLLSYDPKISSENIENLVSQTPQSKIFDLIDAAVAGNAKKALKLYDEQRELGAEPQQIVAMLAWQLHILALIKTAADKSPKQIAIEAKVNPYVVEKSAKLAERLSLTEVKHYVAVLLEIDQALKSTRTDADEALKNYLVSI